MKLYHNKHYVKLIPDKFKESWTVKLCCLSFNKPNSTTGQGAASFIRNLLKPIIMKEYPILFSTEMVKAILEGRKTQTRRVVKPQPPSKCEFIGARKFLATDKRGYYWSDGTYGNMQGFWPGIEKDLYCPFGQPGDRLYVRETFSIFLDAYLFKSTNTIFKGVKWKPSIHMPKDVANIWLEIEEVRVERLESISDEDAKAEGIHYVIDKISGFCGYDYLNGGYNLMTRPCNSFMSLWRKVHGIEKYKPTGNPWVWVIKFKVLSTTGKPETNFPTHDFVDYNFFIDALQIKDKENETSNQQPV